MSQAGDNPIEIRTLINGHAVSRYQYYVFLLCFLILLIDGYDTGIVGFIAPALREQWSLHPAELARLFAVGLLGLTIGSFASGPLADRFGRKTLIIASVSLFGSLTLLSMAASALPQLIVLRFLTGVGLGGAMPNAYALAAEFCPERLRSTLVAPIGAALGAGGAVAGLVASHLIPQYGWRSMLLVGGVAPLFLLAALVFSLPESVRFRVTSGRRPERLVSTLQKMMPRASFQGKRFYIDEIPLRGSPIRALFSEKLLVGTLCLWVAAFMVLLVLFFFANWLPTLIRGYGLPIERAFLMTSIYQWGSTLGAVLLGIVMDRTNAALAVAAAFIVGSAAILSLAWYVDTPYLSLFALLLSGIGTGGAMTGTNILAAALYPTVNRATGISWTLALGRVGSIAGSLIGGALLASRISVPSIFLLMAIPVSVAALSVLTLAHWRHRLLRHEPALSI